MIIFCCVLQGPADVLGLGGEGGSSTDAAAASYLGAFATFRDEVGTLSCARAILSVVIMTDHLQSTHAERGDSPFPVDRLGWCSRVERSFTASGYDSSNK